MKNLTDPAIVKYRMRDEDKRRGVGDGDRAWGGAFLVPCRTDMRLVNILVIASRGDPAGPEEADKWDHLSASHNDRCPTWEEMDYLKRLFFKPEEVAYQLHVAASEHISQHPYCLHIWRPTHLVVPLPPADTVGFVPATRANRLR